VTVTEAFAAAQANVDSREVDGLISDSVLRAIAPALTTAGFEVELGKGAAQRVRRPVLFGENGQQRVAYEVDAVHDGHGIVVEVEAGRGARGNALYRDLIRASLIVDTRFLVVAMMQEYRISQKNGGVTKVASYLDSRAQLEAIYASGRLVLPFDGVLLVGY